MKFKLLGFIFLFGVLSCSHPKEEGQAIVNGTYKGLGWTPITFELLQTERSVVLDSAAVGMDGTFSFSTVPDEKGFYMLRLKDRNPVFLVLDKNDTLNLTLIVKGLDFTYEIEGNEESKILEAYHSKTNQVNLIIDSLSQRLLEGKETDRFAEIKFGIDTVLENTLADHKLFAEQLIRQNPSSLASLLLINQTLAQRALFKPDENPELFFLVEDSLKNRFSRNTHVIEHIKRMDKLRDRMKDMQEKRARVQPGKTVPSLSLTDVDGQYRSLESLRGQAVVLFFWASWSPESRADLQLLKKLYAKYHKNGLEVYAVSMDHKEQFWKAAVEKEGLKWLNVSDLGGMESVVASLFNLPNSLPFYYLIDKEGIIVQRTGDFTTLQQGVEDLVR